MYRDGELFHTMPGTMAISVAITIGTYHAARGSTAGAQPYFVRATVDQLYFNSGAAGGSTVGAPPPAHHAAGGTRHAGPSSRTLAAGSSTGACVAPTWTRLRLSRVLGAAVAATERARDLCASAPLDVGHQAWRR